MIKNIYCEIDFLKVLFERLNRTYSPLDDDWEEGDYARKIIKLLSQGSAIICFDDKEKFIQLQRENRHFFQIVKKSKSTVGYPEMKCDSYISLDSLKEKGLNAMYFVVSGDQIATEKGVMALTPTTINNSILYKDFGQGIKDKEVCEWGNLLRNAKHNCNAIIAFDNFLYKRKEINLYPIFDALLPESLPNNISFQILIFMQQNEGVKLENEYEIISNKLKHMRPKLLFELTIYQCYPTDFHDRAIATNNLWIGSEGGFDLLKKDNYGFHLQSTKDTKTHIIYPFLQESSNWSVVSYNNLMNKALCIMRSHQPIGSNNRNRLLEGYEK